MKTAADANRPQITLLAAAILACLMTSCGSADESLGVLESQGEGGRVAAELILRQGDPARFHQLEDIEYTVRVESYDEVGALRQTGMELHRFEALAPRRYLLRKTAGRVTEIGVLNDRAWARIDGLVVNQPGIRENARRMLAVLWVLSRAPYSLADPGFDIKLMDDLPPTDGRPALRRLAAERRSGSDTERYVFLFNSASGRIHRVLFEAARGASSPLQIAEVGEMHTVDGVELVARWSVYPADANGNAVGIAHESWSVESANVRNGFTDELYGAGGR